jgi:uncharacterized protein (DUF1330 family)
MAPVASSRRIFRMPAYLIAEIEVTDRELYDEYRKGVAATVAAHGGRFVVRGGATETLEGGWTPGRVVILEFPTMAALRQWYDSAEYQPLLALRTRAARSKVIAVEGAAPPA